MKKAIILVAAGLLALGIAVSMVSAAANFSQRPFYMNQQTNLTDAQKQEMVPLWNQMADLRSQMFEVQKQIIQKQVSFGNMTQEDANQYIAQMQEWMDKGYGPGMMGGRGFCRGFGPGAGVRGGQGCQQQP